MGKAWHERLRRSDVDMVPHALPDQESLQSLIWDLPLRLRSFQDEADLYLALLQACRPTFSQLPLIASTEPRGW
jgi:hypothetical protein